jgi:hypothetical protein
MNAHQPPEDPIGAILQRHGSPPIAGLMDDLTDTYRRIGDMLGVRSDARAVTRRNEMAGLHGELGMLAMAAGDQISTREHFLTSTRLSAEDDLTAIMKMDAQLAAPPGDDAIYAVYDLGMGPITFDVVQFLMLAEHFRKLARRKAIYFIFVPAAGDGFRRLTARDKFLSQDRKLWRLLNLLAQCAALLPHCLGTTICQTREEAATLLRGLRQDCIFPAGYTVDTPSCPYFMPQVLQSAAQGGDIRAFRAPVLATSLVTRWFAEIAGDKPIVSITLRQSDFQPARNSNIAAWRDFAKFCVDHGFHPVIVPDTEAMLAGRKTGFEDFSVLDLPALSVGYRMALYQASFINAMVSNGPYTLCAFHPDTRYLLFKILNPAVSNCSPAFLTAQGMPPGSQLPFAGPHQRFVWESDDAEVLIRHFTSMVQAVLAEPVSAV